MRRLKIILQKILQVVISGSARSTRMRQIIDVAVSTVLSQVTTVRHENQDFLFYTPNHMTLMRAQTFTTKEPETLSWIDSMPLNAVLWDVGANVGIYSVYAAVSRRISVIAFEPSVFNLELLAKNVSRNGISDLVTIFPVALTKKTGLATMRLSQVEWGGSMATFDEVFTHDGSNINPLLEYRSLGMTGDDAFQVVKIPQPTHIKLDVDGIEHLVLQGMPHILQNVNSVLVEVNDDFKNQAETVYAKLSEAGLKLSKKCKTTEIKDSKLETVFNQIWEKPY